MLERDDVVADFAQVVRTAFDRRARLGGQELAQGGLRPLDAARQHRFTAHERPEQQMRIREAASLASEPSDGAVRVR
jgi:hypothetical protein